MINRLYHLLVLFILIFATINYFPKEVHAEGKSKIQETEDVVFVSNPKTPESRMRIIFKEELSIGEVGGDENYMYGRGVVFNTDDKGNFYVADFDNHRILKYDPEGKHLLTFGREGQGPREFRFLSAPRFDKDSNVYITDGGNRRISFFDKNGKYLKQIKMKERHDNIIINSKGFMVANKWNVSSEEGKMKITSIYGLFDDKFNLAAELYIDKIELPPPAARDGSSLADSLAKMLSTTAFRPNVIYALANNDFIYLGYPDKYEINIYSPEGELVKKITRDYAPIPVSERDKEAFIQRADEGFSSPIYTEEVKKKAFQKVKYPKYKPAYQSFTLMENGWLLVIVDSIEDEYTFCDIYDREGKYIAQFKTSGLASGLFTRFLFFKNGKAYSVAIEDDYFFVKRYNFEIQEHIDNKWIRKK